MVINFHHQTNQGDDRAAWSYFARPLHWISNVLGLVIREKEKDRLTTVLQSVLGYYLVWYFFPRWICALSVLLLGLCDPLAKFGKVWPIYRFPNRKSVGGMLFGLSGGIVACVLIVITAANFQLFPANLKAGHIALVYTVGVVSAPFFELVGGKWDNLLIVVGSTVLMALSSWCLPA